MDELPRVGGRSQRVAGAVSTDGTRYGMKMNSFRLNRLCATSCQTAAS